MKIDKNHRAGLRRFRKILRLKQEELAARLTKLVISID